MLKKQLAELDSRVQRCETDKKLAANSSNCYGFTPSPPLLSTDRVDHDFKFHFNSCSLVSSALQCDFLVTNLLGDRELSVVEGRIIDDSGNQYPATGFALGSTSYEGFSRTILPGGVPVKMEVKFGSVRPETKHLAILEVSGYNVAHVRRPRYGLGKI